VRGDLLTRYAEVETSARMSKQGPKIVRVVMAPGQDLLAKRGSMIAYEGLVDFRGEVPKLRQFARSWATGEGVKLMNCAGQGDLFLADYGRDVVILQLAGDALSVDGEHLLAFDASLDWNIERVKGATLLAGQGMFNVSIRGQGWVALTSHGTPVVLNCGEAPTYVDTGALVAWTTALRVKPHRTAKLMGMFGRGSGEAFQLAFAGQGYVVVQPSEPGGGLSVRG
jgi:uncharacterized protein (AIM24 family)